jgi:hypothetical protein
LEQTKFLAQKSLELQSQQVPEGWILQKIQDEDAKLKAVLKS